MNCKFCDKETKNKNSLKNHERLCPKNPNRQESNLKYRSTTVPWNKGLDKNDPRVAKNAENVSKTLKGRPCKIVWTDEMRKVYSDRRKEMHKNNPETHPNRRLANNRKKMSYPEKLAFDFLSNKGLLFEHNPKVGKYYPDFVIGNLIIEIDGERWHNKDKDVIRDKELESLGYKIYRISTKEQIEKRIQEILSMA